MIDKLYSIPVIEVFEEDCECPLCLLHERLENESVGYCLGPSLMETDQRLELNKKGFCKKHFEMLYYSRENILGLALIIDTHLKSTTEILKNKFSDALKPGRKKDPELTKLAAYLHDEQSSCAICDKLDATMKRYIDTMLYLWAKEPDFRIKFNSGKGFCLYHLAMILDICGKSLKQDKKDDFLRELFKLQTENLDRVGEDINWFARKFDYINQDASWKNSRDAVPRSIQKLVGYFRKYSV